MGEAELDQLSAHFDADIIKPEFDGDQASDLNRHRLLVSLVSCYPWYPFTPNGVDDL